MQVIGEVPNASGITYPPSLTYRELMIVHLMGAGHTTSKIATLLKLRPRTVENRKRHIYEKLGVGSQSQAIARAIGLGLFQPGRPGNGRALQLSEPGREPLVVLLGPVGKDLNDVARLLVTERIAFLAVQDRKGLSHDHALLWHRGPIVVVLVNPASQDRQAITSLGAPALEICSSDVPEPLAVADVMVGKTGGLIAKADVTAGLSSALEAISKGLLIISWRYATALLRFAVDASPMPSHTQLTAREQDILDSIAHGHTTRQTARALGIATKTVENIQAMLFRKLGAHNRMDALTVANDRGLIDPDALLAGQPESASRSPSR